MKHISILSRLVAEWKIKLFAGGLATGVFWICYFLLERYPVFPVRIMPASIFDRLVPFVPAAAPVYVSQFITMSLLAWLMTSKQELLAFCKGIALISIVSFLVFFFYPTCVVRPQEPVIDHDFIYDAIVRIDNPRNAFPSLHAAFGIFLAAYAPVVFRGWNSGRILVGIVWLCTAAVLASTLLTKQHVLMDVLAGSLLGFAGYFVSARTASKSISASAASGEI
jgi:membrane-associated phospholipid phosphatase